MSYDSRTPPRATIRGVHVVLGCPVPLRHFLNGMPEREAAAYLFQAEEMYLGIRRPTVKAL